MGGASSNKGKLEYCHYGAWSSVCYNFHDEEATVACKQMGFSGLPSKNISVYRKKKHFASCSDFVEAALITDGRFGHRWNFSSFWYFSCYSSASQSSLATCSQYDTTCGYRCTHNYGIACYGEKFGRKDCFVQHVHDFNTPPLCIHVYRVRS